MSANQSMETTLVHHVIPLANEVIAWTTGRYEGSTFDHRQAQ